MVEFIQQYGIWILLAGGMFLMHRLGIGCCGGHGHGRGRAHRDAPKTEPTPAGGAGDPAERKSLT